ncbi:MAG: hypothetical protein QW775_04755 [Ignisphaera sp.]
MEGSSKLLGGAMESKGAMIRNIIYGLSSCIRDVHHIQQRYRNHVEVPLPMKFILFINN